MEPYAINTIVEHARQVHLEVDCLRLILSGQHLWGILSWANIHARREGTLESKEPMKCKFFFWLALYRQCWTTERRKQQGLQDHNNCELCDNVARKSTTSSLVVPTVVNAGSKYFVQHACNTLPQHPMIRWGICGSNRARQF